MALDLRKKNIQIMARLFKLFSSESRLRILLLIAHGETNVGRIAETLKLSQSLVSHNLRFLKMAGAVTERKSGREVFYQVSNPQIEGILQAALSAPPETSATAA